MNFHPLFTWFLQLVNPIKGLSHFRLYMRLVRQIRTEKKPITLKLISLIHFLLFVKSFHFFTLIFLDSTSSLKNILHFNYLIIIFSKSILNLIAAAAIFAIAKISQLLLLKVDQRLMGELESVLIHENDGFFLEPKLAGKSIVKVVQQFFFYEFNLFNGFVPFFNILLILVEVYYISLMCTLEGAFTQMNYFEMLSFISFHIISALSCWFASYCFFLVFSFANSTLIPLLLMFYIKMHQIYTLIQRESAQMLSDRTIPQIQRHLIESTSFFFAINRMYSGIFLNNLLILAPTNALLTAILILNQSDHKLFICSCILYLFIFIFALHLILAYATKAIHRPARLLNCLAVHFSPSISGQTRNRLKLAHLIAHFHTVRRFGFHYGIFGLVSTKSFAKFTLLYIKILLISLKMLKRNVF